MISINIVSFFLNLKYMLDFCSRYGYCFKCDFFFQDRKNSPPFLIKENQRPNNGHGTLPNYTCAVLPFNFA